MFAIEIADPNPCPERYGQYLGRVRFGDFTEHFGLAPGDWSAEDYERSWHCSLLELVIGADAAALMSWMYKPGTDRPYRAWIGYRNGAAVYFQDVLLLRGIADLRFSRDESLLTLPVRAAISIHGDPISEWGVSLNDVKVFLRQRSM